MLRVLRSGSAHFDEASCDPDVHLPDDAVWIDLLKPTRVEELAVEKALGIQLPTKDDVAELQPSSRLYQDNGSTFISAFVLVNAETDRPDTAPVTFVLTGAKLVTIRYGDPKSFKMFAEKAERQPGLCATSVTTFLNLFDAIVDRTADILERVDDDTDGISRAIFQKPRSSGFEQCLYALGRAQTTNSEIRHSLASLNRAASFATLHEPGDRTHEYRNRLRNVVRDITSLNQLSDSLSNNIAFLLNAALGLINIEQSNIIKIFSIAAVVLLPPTLVASVYGMNFDFMPELKWRYGYPYALALMALSVAATLWYFKRKRWL